VSADYSQIELRIMAHCRRTTGCSRRSPPAATSPATAAEVFGVAPELVADDLRRSAKAINLRPDLRHVGVRLAQQLKIERSAAQQYLTCISRGYPGGQGVHGPYRLRRMSRVTWKPCSGGAFICRR